MAASSSSSSSVPAVSGPPVEANEANLRRLADLLTQAGNGVDEAARRSATETLAGLEGRPGFPILCLRLSCTSGAPTTTRQLAAVAFKNFVKKSWALEPRVAASDRDECKQRLPDAAANASSCQEVMSQLGEAISIISLTDFHEKWPSLLPSIVDKLKSPDPVLVCGLLDILHAVFKRYANPPKSHDDVIRELLYVLPIFAEPLHALYVSTSRAIHSSPDDEVTLRWRFRSLLSLTRIYYYILLIDLPEYFENNCKTIFPEFRRFLAFAPVVPALQENPDNPAKPTPLHELQGAIFDCLNIWSEKFEEQFEPFLQGFAETTWNLLLKYDSKTRYDPVITNALCFLTTTAKSVQYEVFTKVLQNVCNNIIAPHVMFRQLDMEQFNDCPFDYVRFDSEGADAETRRRACSDLLRALRKNFEQQITGFAAAHIRKLLADYKASPREKWRAKDAAIFLMQAILVVEETQANGVEEINRNVPFADFFKTEIVPELQNKGGNPVVQADCLKFCFTFRNQIPDAALASVYTACAPFLNSPSVVVHSYAATAVERFLAARDPATKQPRLARDVAVKILPPILSAIFKQLKTPESRENHYLMKLLFRIARLFTADIVGQIGPILEQLKAKLFEIAKNPTNPLFHDLLFETIAALIANTCASEPAKVTSFESSLLGPFHEILKRDVDEFLPYVFQILAQMLVVGSTLREPYKGVFDNFLNPVLYENAGNIPALSLLIRGYIKQDAKFVHPYLPKVLGVFQKLLSLKSLDHEGFYLMEAIVQHFPQAAVESSMGAICKLILTRLRSSGTGKYIRCMIVFFSLVCCKYSPDFLLAKLEGVQSGMAGTIFDKFWIKHAPGVTGRLERKLTALGFAKLLCESPAFLKHLHERWPACLRAVMETLAGPEQVIDSATDADYESLEKKSYSSGYSRLVSIPKESADPFPDVNPAAVLARGLAKLTSQHPDKFGGPIRSLPPNLREALQSYCTAANVSLSI